jgi:hypothetical protein
VVVTHEDGQWLADVPDLQGAHTYARSLPRLDHAVREVIVLADDLPDEVMPELVIDYDYHTGDPDLDVVTGEVRRLRRQADELASWFATVWPVPQNSSRRPSAGSRQSTRSWTLVPLGRTNTPEMGTTVTTEPMSFPPARNARQRRRRGGADRALRGRHPGRSRVLRRRGRRRAAARRTRPSRRHLVFV